MSHRWGQCFLTDIATRQRIVDAASITAQDHVIEIGPGHGELTALYAAKAARVTAIEIDPALCGRLNDTYLASTNIEFLQGDVRAINFEAIASGTPPVILGNLPYYCSKPILEKILECNVYKRSVIMLQSELVHRLTAGPGTSEVAALTIFFQWRAQGSLLFDVPATCFRPQPKVGSSVIAFSPSSAPASQGLKAAFKHVVNAAFHNRRKMLTNNLMRILPHTDKKAVEGILIACGIASNARAQEICVDDFLKLTALTREKIGM